MDDSSEEAQKWTISVAPLSSSESSGDEDDDVGSLPEAGLSADPFSRASRSGSRRGSLVGSSGAGDVSDGEEEAGAWSSLKIEDYPSIIARAEAAEATAPPKDEATRALEAEAVEIARELSRKGEQTATTVSSMKKKKKRRKEASEGSGSRSSRKHAAKPRENSDPEPERKSAPEPEPEPEPEGESEPEPEVETEPELDSEPESESEPASPAPPVQKESAEVEFNLRRRASEVNHFAIPGPPAVGGLTRSTAAAVDDVVDDPVVFHDEAVPGFSTETLEDKKLVDFIDDAILRRNDPRSSFADGNGERVLLVLGAHHVRDSDRVADCAVCFREDRVPKTSAVNNHALVVGRFRLYLVANKGLVRKSLTIERQYHWFTLRTLAKSSVDPQCLVLRFGGKLGSLVVATPGRQLLLHALRSAYARITCGLPPDRQASCVVPANWLTKVDLKAIVKTPAAGFVATYVAHCDYRRIAASSGIIQHVRDAVARQSRSLDLTTIPGIEENSTASFDFGSLAGSLKFNLYFRSLELVDVSLKRRAVALPSSGNERKAMSSEAVAGSAKDQASHTTRKACHALCDIFSTNRHLTRLRLVRCGVKSFEALGAGLLANKANSLTSLDLSRNELSPASFVSLCRAFQSLGHGLTVLRLAECHLGPRYLALLFSSLEANFGSSLCLEVLDLSGNRFGEQGSAALARWVACVKGFDKLRVLLLAGASLDFTIAGPAIAALGGVEQLDVSKTKLSSSDALSALEDVAAWPALRSLRVVGCSLTGAGLARVAVALGKNKEARAGQVAVSLARNVVSNERDGAVFAEAFSRGAACLGDLDVSGCHLSPANVSTLLHSLSSCRNLRTLSIGENVGARPAGSVVADLFNFIMGQRLQSLSLARDTGYTTGTVGAEAIRDLFQGLRGHSTLEHLDLSGIGMDDSLLVDLCIVLRTNTSLRTLSLAGNSFTLSGFVELAAAVRQSTCLEEVKLGASLWLKSDAVREFILAPRYSADPKWMVAKVKQLEAATADIAFYTRLRREQRLARARADKDDQEELQDAQYEEQVLMAAPDKALVPEHLQLYEPDNFEDLARALVQHQEHIEKNQH